LMILVSVLPTDHEAEMYSTPGESSRRSTGFEDRVRIDALVSSWSPCVLR